MNIIEFEKPDGVIASLGGQTAINLADPLMRRGVKIIGTDCVAIERAENRDSFEKILHELNIPQPRGKAVTNIVTEFVRFYHRMKSLHFIFSVVIVFSGFVRQKAIPRHTTTRL